MKSVFIALPLALFFTSASFAGSAKEPIQLNIATGNVPGQVEMIQQAIQQPEYVEMTSADRTTLNRQLAALQQGQLDTVGTSDAQQQVNAILKKAYADSRIVCVFEKPLGSNLKQRTCKTVAAKKKQHQNTQNT